MSVRPAPTSDAVLECRAIHKAFGGVPVLKGVSLALQPGTVTALAGENGAGKSTLMKIASGQYRPDKGDVLVDGTELSLGHVAEARRAGIAIVPQELASIEDLTVYENLMVGREIHRGGFLQRGAMVRAAKQALSLFDVDIDPRTRMGRLPVGLRQIVEIVKACEAGARVLLLDEPTSAISEREVDDLYAVVRRLREQRVAMVYTTHKMAEIRALADRVVVLRDGQLVLDQDMTAVRDDEIVTAMIGRELESLFPEVARPAEEEALVLKDLQVQGASAPVSLRVRRGEIVGLAGLVGAGRTELLETVFAVRPRLGGAVEVGGQAVGGKVRDCIAARMALVPEDRKAAGAILGMSVLDNASLPRLESFNIAGWLRNSARSDKVTDAMRSVRLRSRGLAQEVGTLSGGNQQKVVLARWLTGPVDVLLLDEPTRGVDVGARSEIYRIVADLAASGMAVVMASSDMTEILGLSHRALVMHGGAMVGELSREELSRPDAQERIFHLAAGTATAADDSDTTDGQPHASSHSGSARAKETHS